MINISIEGIKNHKKISRRIDDIRKDFERYQVFAHNFFVPNCLYIYIYIYIDIYIYVNMYIYDYLEEK